MKFLISFIVTVGLALNLNAQTKSLDIYDVIKDGIPDSLSTNSLCEWTKGLSINPIIKWSKKNVQKDNVQYFKTGNANLKSYGRKPEDASIFLAGPTSSGYSEIQISTTPVEDYTLEKLFEKKPFKSHLLKKDDGGFPTYYYKLNIPGKKEVWVIIMYSMGGTMGGSSTVDIVVLFDYKEFKSRSGI